METGLTTNLYLLTPEFALVALAFLVFTVDLFLPERAKEWLAGLSAVSLVAVIVIALLMRPGGSAELYGGLMVVDDFGLFFKVFFCAIGLGIIALSVEYGRDRLQHRGEFYGLLLFFHRGDEPVSDVAGAVDGVHRAGIAVVQPVRAGGLRTAGGALQRGWNQVHHHRGAVVGDNAVRG